MEGMKQKISVSLETGTITWLDNQAATGKFRNRSHVIEYAIQELQKSLVPKNGEEAKK